MHYMFTEFDQQAPLYVLLITILMKQVLMNLHTCGKETFDVWCDNNKKTSQFTTLEIQFRSLN